MLDLSDPRDRSTDPEFPKEVFPRPEQCPHCHTAGDSWDLDATGIFLQVSLFEGVRGVDFEKYHRATFFPVDLSSFAFLQYLSSPQEFYGSVTDLPDPVAPRVETPPRERRPEGRRLTLLQRQAVPNNRGGDAGQNPLSEGRVNEVLAGVDGVLAGAAREHIAAAHVGSGNRNIVQAAPPEGISLFSSALIFAGALGLYVLLYRLRIVRSSIPFAVMLRGRKRH